MNLVDPVVIAGFLVVACLIGILISIVKFVVL